MKTLSSCINNFIFNERLEAIDAELVYEALQDSKLLELAKRLSDFAKEAKSFKNYTFAKLLGRHGVAWDQVTDADWTEYDVDKNDEKSLRNIKKEVRRCFTDSKNSFPGIVLGSYDGKQIDFYINNNATVIDFKSRVYVPYGERKNDDEMYISGPQRRETLKQYEILDYVERAKKIWILDITNRTVYDKRTERYAASKDIVYAADEEYNKRIAKENLERYKKIIAKNKAEKAAKKDTVSADVQEILNTVMDITTAVAKNPVKYADITFKITTLLSLVYSKMSYNHGVSSGVNGLLVEYNNYISYLTATAKDGGYSYERTGLSEAKEKIYAIIDKINKSIETIKEKM